MNWSWSAQEDSAMDYLPHRAQVMYLRILRRRMDYKTCVVGLTVRLSYQLIGEWMEERPAVRSTKPLVRLTVGEIRAVFVVLERAGLVERVLNDKDEVMPLVFKLPLAQTGLIRPKYERQMSNSKKQLCTTAISATEKKLINWLFAPESARVSNIKSVVDKCEEIPIKIAMNDSAKIHENAYEQQTSGSINIFNNNIYTFRARNSEGAVSVVPEAWLPSVETVENLVINFMLPPDFIFLKAIEFRLLWLEQGKEVADWDGYFYGACRNQIQNASEDFMQAITNNSGVAHE